MTAPLRLLVLVAALAALLVNAACDGSSFDDIVSATDSDGDGVADATDNCDAAPNPDQADADSDGFGNTCDCTYLGDACLNESSARGNCANGVDDDGDQVVDALDQNCRVESTDVGNCGDAIDNDGDGVVDCAESSCAGAPGCPGGP